MRKLLWLIAALGFALPAEGTVWKPNRDTTQVTAGRRLIAAYAEVDSAQIDSATVDTLKVTGELQIEDGSGAIVGHTAHATGIGDGAVTPEFQIIGTTETDAGVLVLLNSTTDALSPTLWLIKSGNATLGSAGTVVADDEELGSVRFGGSDATDFGSEGASLAAFVDGTPGTGDLPTRLVLSTTADGAQIPTERMRIDQGGATFLNVATNTNTTMGLTITQAGNDDHIFTLQSSDVVHGLTTAMVAAGTNDFYRIGKASATLGGVNFAVFAEDAALTVPYSVNVAGGTANTNKGTASLGLVSFIIYEQDGSNGLANITADGNVFAIRARVGGSTVTRFLIDEDGDMYTVIAGQTFDTYDDAELTRALDRTTTPGGVIESKWDEYISYNEETLIEAGILGAPVADGGMLNVTQLQRLHNGAIWQNHTRIRDGELSVQELRAQIATLQTDNETLKRMAAPLLWIDRWINN